MNSQAHSATQVEVRIACCQHADREVVRQIREWKVKSRDPIVNTIRDVCQERRLDDGGLADGIDAIRADPEHMLLVAAGYDATHVIRHAHGFPGDAPSPIIIMPRQAPRVSHPPSASLLSPWHPMAVASPFYALRKALLRLATRTIGQVRILEPNDDEIAEYLKLRHEVWDEMGYLDPDKYPHSSLFEVDYTDRNALPIGVFDTHGTIMGAARLVGPLGPEFPDYVKVIERLIDQCHDEQLREHFKAPAQLWHQFDVLAAFNDFGSYYAMLTQQGRTPAAEVSRVVVKREYRGQCLGEVLVDSLVSAARARGVQTLFLACRTEHARFYERCGFQRINNMTHDHFLHLQHPSVAMDRALTIQQHGTGS